MKNKESGPMDQPQKFLIHALIFITVFWLMYGLVFGFMHAPNNDMYPRIDSDDLILYYRLDTDMKAQDIAVLKKNNTVYIGRVVAVGGDTVDITDNGRLVINGHPAYETNIFYETQRYEGFVDYPVTLEPDTVAWLTIDGANIDYPILQGRDDLEYINKDIYGKSSLTGSLYLRTKNNADFSDNYNLIYGHHMDNGAMFGDIGKYIDQSFFDAHRSGILMSPAQNYDIKIFAAMKTDAYNDLLYFKEINSSQKYNTVIEYIEKNSVIFKNDTPRDKIIAFSTCMDSQTNGRTMVFASLTPLTGVIAKAEDPTPIKRTATGHYTNSKGWAFLNLLCVICTLLTLLPFIFTGNKYYQFVYAAKMSKEETNEKIAKDLRFFKYKIMIGTLTETFFVAFSVLLFIKTQYIRGSLSIIDKYTGIMIAVFALTLLADIIFFRYRGQRPKS